jgi:hypothetical protein
MNVLLQDLARQDAIRALVAEGYNSDEVDRWWTEVFDSRAAVPILEVLAEAFTAWSTLSGEPDDFGGQQIISGEGEPY